MDNDIEEVFRKKNINRRRLSGARDSGRKVRFSSVIEKKNFFFRPLSSILYILNFFHKVYILSVLLVLL